MLDISKTFFWFAFGIALLVIAGFGGYALYNLGRTIKEARKTLKEINEELEKIDNIVNSVSSAVDSVKTVVNIIKPATIVTLASKAVQEIGKIVGIFRKKSEEKK